MYRVLYHGPERSTYLRLKDGLPADMRLDIEPDWTRLKETVTSKHAPAVVLPLIDPGPEEYQHLRRIVGLPGAPGVIVTADRITAPQAVCCIRYGAFDCLTGPVTGSHMAASLYRMFSLRNNRQTGDDFQIAGDSDVIRNLVDRVVDYAVLRHPVLITGETGTGKELVARILHCSGPRRDGPFVAINCAGYSDDLLLSELFGSRKGAYTGSIDRPGLIESADGGTLFLDEIGEMSVQGQACLLRVIEEGRIRRMGSNHQREVDVRIVAATNRNLQTAIRDGRFRADLFYRLNLLAVTVPPLRKRRQDIPVLTRNYLQAIRPDMIWNIDSSAMAKLVRHSWPGNVRELQSVLLKASLGSRNGLILPGNLDLR